jgi:Zn-dependent protease/predicted transcriptional regulator
MFGGIIKQATLLGFEIRIGLSLNIIAVLIAWSLSTRFFLLQNKDLIIRTYWIMGVLVAFGLFLSVIVHEFSRTLMARKLDLPTKGITLLVFGGGTEMSEEMQSPKAEFLMASIGPFTCVGMAVLFYGGYVAGSGAGLTQPFNGVFGHLAVINAILAAFNLLPVFPLDGGRVLRSILWAWKKNLRWATRVSSQIGSAFGILLVVLGVFNVLRGNFIGGMWWFLIGMFLQGAARMSYRQLVLRRALDGETVRRFMKAEPVTVPASTLLSELVEEYIYKHHHKVFPVVEDGRKLIGCVTSRRVKEISWDEWPSKTVGQVADSCSPDNTVTPDEDAMKALSTMNRTGSSRILVMEGERLAGILTLKDMLKFLSLKIEMEDE